MPLLPTTSSGACSSNGKLLATPCLPSERFIHLLRLVIKHPTQRMRAYNDVAETISRKRNRKHARSRSRGCPGPLEPRLTCFIPPISKSSSSSSGYGTFLMPSTGDCYGGVFRLWRQLVPFCLLTHHAIIVEVLLTRATLYDG